MGALADITTSVNNSSYLPAGTMMALHSITNEQSHQSAKEKPPHFMSPTLSSSKQNSLKAGKDRNRISTPLSLKSGTQSSNWMASAAKRVRIRTGGGTPRSRKEGMASKAITFPDKLAASSYAELPDSPQSAKIQAKTPLSEKPLPSPPIAEVVGSSPLKETRSLIDASERPLRRSPPGNPSKQEDWPVLCPNKSSLSSPPLRKDRQKRSLSPPVLTSSTPTQIERYPTFSNTSRPTPQNEVKVVNNAPPKHMIRRKEISSDDPGPHSGINTEAIKVDNFSVAPACTEDSQDVVPEASIAINQATITSDLSASAAAIEKSMYETGSLGQPRQTRTSSLRARLSAGQLIKDSPAMKSKVVGFTDFTTMNGNPLQANTDYPYAPAEMQNRSASPSARRLCGTKLSKESLRGNRASAQFVGGSRRPTVHRHPSRASLRDDIRTTGAPFTQPQKNSLSTPQNDTNAETVAKASRSDLPKTSEPRRSSIPVFRHTVSSMVSQAENERIKMNDDAASHLEEPHRDDFGIFEDPMDGSTPEKISKQHGLDTMAGLDPLENRKISQVLTNLEAIEESPKQNFQVRRLSLASPELGPTLKIHESAERLILGPEADKENQTESQLINNSYHRRSAGRMNLQHNQGAGKNSSFKKRTGRPSSTQELSYSASRTSSVNKDVRDKKIKSADLSYSLPTDHLHQESEKMKIQISRKNTASTNADDPFFDAQSSYKSDDADCKNHLVIEKKSDEEENGASAEKEPWISPLPYEPELSLDSQLDHVNTDKPSNFQDKPGNDPTIVLGNLSTISTNLLAAESSNDMPNNLQFYKVTALNQDPSTPTYSTDHLGSSNSSSFPPRSSSRTTPPDYTTNSSRKTSPNLPSKTNTSPSEDFLSRQNKLGSSKGLASSQLGPGHVSLKRRSVARESNKSRNSLSKGMLSNFRGLFHKRHSDHESFSSIKTNGKSNSKTSIVSNGSPFPSVSEVHPIHRPTLASTNRSLRRKDSALDASIRTPATPAFASPLPSEISTTTTLAMQLLESVRNEKSSPKKERSLELGTILVEAITQARDAERAMEEAKRAARKAEVAHALCEKSVGSIAARIQEWRNESAGS